MDSPRSPRLQQRIWFLSTAPSKTGSAGRSAKSAIKPVAKSAVKPARKTASATKLKASASGKSPAAAKRAVKSPVAAKSPPRARKRTVPAVVVSAPAEDSRMLAVVLARLDDMKAEHPVVIDMRGKSLFSDHMVVASGRSNRHVAACAEAVAKGLKDAGAKKVHMEGLTNADWVLIDTGEVIIHIFRPEVREFYNLERLWSQNTDALAQPA